MENDKPFCNGNCDKCDQIKATCPIAQDKNIKKRSCFDDSPVPDGECHADCTKCSKYPATCGHSLGNRKTEAVKVSEAKIMILRVLEKASCSVAELQRASRVIRAVDDIESVLDSMITVDHTIVSYEDKSDRGRPTTRYARYDPTRCYK